MWRNICAVKLPRQTFPFGQGEEDFAEGIFSYIFAQNEWLKLRNKRFIAHTHTPASNTRDLVPWVSWASRAVVCWRLWNGNCMIRFYKGCYCHQASDAFWGSKRQITSAGQLFPWFQSPGAVLWPEAMCHCILFHIVSLEKLEKHLLAWWIVCLTIKLQAAPDSLCADFLQVIRCSVLIQFSEILLAWQATLAHAHAENLAKSHLLKLPSFIGQFVKHWKHSGGMLQCQQRCSELIAATDQ